MSGSERAGRLCGPFWSAAGETWAPLLAACCLAASTSRGLRRLSVRPARPSRASWERANHWRARAASPTQLDQHWQAYTDRHTDRKPRSDWPGSSRHLIDSQFTIRRPPPLGPQSSFERALGRPANLGRNAGPNPAQKVDTKKGRSGGP